MFSRKQYSRNIQRNLKSLWGEYDEFQLQDVPMIHRVLKFKRTPEEPLITFATCGMSYKSDAKKIECFILSPTQDDSLSDLLTILAWYYRTDVRLGWGHTVNFGRAWLPQSRCDYGLLLLSYLDEPKLAWLNSDCIHTRFLWLISITIQERNLNMKYGLEEPESRFEKASLDYGNPYRQSVVGSSEVEA